MGSVKMSLLNNAGEMEYEVRQRFSDLMVNALSNSDNEMVYYLLYEKNETNIQNEAFDENHKDIYYKTYMNMTV